jgi:Flp pilus assembly protein TadG
MVETAIVIGVLVAIVIIAVDFGKAVNYWNNETHIADLTARYAAVGSLPSYGTCGTNNPAVTSPSTFAECELGIDSKELVNGGGKYGVHQPGTNAAGGATVCIYIPSGANSVGNPVTVQIGLDYDWLPLPILGGHSFTTSLITGSATQRLETTYTYTDSTTTACTN